MLFLFSSSFNIDITSKIMTCDSINDKLESIVNNNNVNAPNGEVKNIISPNDKETEVSKELPNHNEENTNRKSLIVLASIFITSLLAMLYIYNFFPQLEESEKKHVKIPFDIEDAKQLGLVLNRYKDLYYFQVMCGICLVYLL